MDRTAHGARFNSRRKPEEALDPLEEWQWWRSSLRVSMLGRAICVIRTCRLCAEGSNGLALQRGTGLHLHCSSLVELEQCTFLDAPRSKHLNNSTADGLQLPL